MKNSQGEKRNRISFSTHWVLYSNITHTAHILCPSMTWCGAKTHIAYPHLVLIFFQPSWSVVPCSHRSTFLRAFWRIEKCSWPSRGNQPVLLKEMKILMGLIKLITSYHMILRKKHENGMKKRESGVGKKTNGRKGKKDIKIFYQCISSVNPNYHLLTNRHGCWCFPKWWMMSEFRDSDILFVACISPCTDHNPGFLIFSHSWKKWARYGVRNSSEPLHIFFVMWRNNFSSIRCFYLDLDLVGRRDGWVGWAGISSNVNSSIHIRLFILSSKFRNVLDGIPIIIPFLCIIKEKMFSLELKIIIWISSNNHLNLCRKERQPYFWTALRPLLLGSHWTVPNSFFGLVYRFSNAISRFFSRVRQCYRVAWILLGLNVATLEFCAC